MSVEPTWRREVGNILRSYMTMALEQNHRTWYPNPLPSYLFLGSCHVCLHCQPLSSVSDKTVGWSAKVLLSPSTCLTWLRAASYTACLLLSGLLLIESISTLNAGKFPKVRFWWWYLKRWPLSIPWLTESPLTPKNKINQGVVWLGITGRPRP